MTEAEWQACTDPVPMMFHLRGPGTETEAETGWLQYGSVTLVAGPSDLISCRKCQLFAAACCRRLGYLASDVDCLCLATDYEHFADTLLDTRELQAAYQARWNKMHAANRSRLAASVCQLWFPLDARCACSCALDIAWMLAWAKAGDSVERTCAGVSEEERWVWGFCGGPPDVNWQNVCRTETATCAAILRHIVGNPFRPFPAPPSWPAPVVTLARSLYAGEDCSFALRGALLEDGHRELAEHFAGEQWHPKGCFAVDLVLGKE